MPAIPPFGQSMGYWPATIETIKGISMKKITALAFVLFILSGCAGAKKNSVVSLGEGTYLISKSGRWVNTKGAKLMDQAYDEAIQHCGKKGRKLLRIIKSEQRDMVHGEDSIPAAVELKFQCL